MVTNTARILALAAACLAAIAATPPCEAQSPPRKTVVVKHPPVANPGDVSGSGSAQQNVAASKQYERLLRTNPAFRRARMHKECGPITDPELRESCLASFERYAGPSKPARRQGSSGR